VPRAVATIAMTGLMIAAVVVLAGCSPQIEDWQSPEPSGRMQRIVKAVRENDQTAVPRLVRSLRSDDALIRMTAGDALIRLTGQDFGYRYDQPEADRREAMKRWESWLAETRSAGNTLEPTGGAEPTRAPGPERSNP